MRLGDIATASSDQDDDHDLGLCRPGVSIPFFRPPSLPRLDDALLFAATCVWFCLSFGCLASSELRGKV